MRLTSASGRVLSRGFAWYRVWVADSQTNWLGYFYGETTDGNIDIVWSGTDGSGNMLPDMEFYSETEIYPPGQSAPGSTAPALAFRYPQLKVNQSNAHDY